MKNNGGQMRDYYPVGTLVRHRYYERGLGLVVNHRKQKLNTQMIVRWFSSTLKTECSLWELIDIEEIDNGV